MALQVWLPLNGNLNNNGLNNGYTITNTGTVDASGKIGPCYSYNKTYTMLQQSPISGLGCFSVACWVYLTSTNYNIFTFENNPYWQFVLRNNTLGIRDSVSGLTGTRIDKSITTIPQTTWVHLAFVYNFGTVMFYQNGVLKDTLVYHEGATMNTHNTLCIGADVKNGVNYYPGNCKINDFRVYDHCLTQQEIKEISKGLVLHYPLDTREIALSKCSNVTFNQLLTNGNFISDFGWVNAVNCTYSISNNIITITKGAYTGIGGVCKATPLSVYKTHKYYFKGTIRCLSIDAGFTASFFGFHGSNGNVSGNSKAFNYTTEWETLSVLTSPTSNTDIFAIRAGTSATNGGFSIQCKNIILVDLTLMFGSGKEPSKEDCDKIFINDYYEYNEGTPTNLVEPIKDCSGYKYDGIIEGDASLFSDSPRYNSYAFFSEDATITSYNALINYETPFSFSLWCNFENSNSNFALRGRSLTKIFNFGVNSNNNYQFVIFTPPLGYFGVQAGTVKTGWHHYAGVYNGTTANLYIDGKLEIVQNTINNTYQTNVPTEQFLRIHDSGWNESLQTVDVRLYSTALSDDDIADLYHTSAVVNNNGSLHTFQVKEENTEPEITATGSTITREFVEITDNEYLYLPSNVCVPITDATYVAEDVLMAKTVIRYATGGSGRDLMGLNTSGHAYWGVTSGGAWEPHGTFTYTNSDITVKNSISYTRTVNSGENWGHYTIGALYASSQNSNPYGYSTRNKYIYHVSLYKNGDLIKDLYPMKEGLYCGLYDIVSDTFYPCNKTTGVLGSDAGSPVLSVYKDKIETSNIIEY